MYNVVRCHWVRLYHVQCCNRWRVGGIMKGIGQYSLLFVKILQYCKHPILQIFWNNNINNNNNIHSTTIYKSKSYTAVLSSSVKQANKEIKITIKKISNFMRIYEVRMTSWHDITPNLHYFYCGFNIKTLQKIIRK